MKISKCYQITLAYRCRSTNIISCSWSVFYKGEYINGADYNGVTILSSVLPCGLIVYSKNMARIKGYIRAYKQNILKVQ